MTSPTTPVLLVEDRDSLRAMLRESLEAEGFAVREAADGSEALRALASERFMAVVTDLKLPGADGHQVLAAARDADPHVAVIVVTAYGTVEDAVNAMKGGAFDFLSKPVDPDHLVLLLRRAVERRSLLEENILLKEEFAERLGFPRIIGDSAALREVSMQIQKAAPTDATILLQGESGTGKELFARAIHHLSPRKDAPFVAINCAAIPETLLENELFGHEKGAYTGAGNARAGRMELADGGTLLLDEIGELGAAVQAKLLRVLQEKSFERVGGNRTIKVDLRLIAASNRDLRKAAAEKLFREDLYFRLAVVTVTVPPLRERSGDIPALAKHFLEKYSREFGREDLEFTTEALESMIAHDWPGNIRELENCVERSAILADESCISADCLGLRSLAGSDEDLAVFARTVGLDGTLDSAGERARNLAERLMIERALREAEGNKTRAAEALQVNYKRFLSKIRALGIS